MSRSILVVEDDSDTAELVRDALQRRGFEARAVHTAADCFTQLRQRPADVVITDVNLGSSSGIDLCKQLHREFPDILPIVLTGASGVETAIAAIRAGAYDYLTKPVRVDVLAVAVSRADQHLTLKRELARLRVEAANVPASAIAGSSPAIRATTEMISRVADIDATVLITGESGTGKELVARTLHMQSSRRDQPFIAINCAAMPAPLLESELFGHVRGAFTDAKQSRLGLFVQAGRGTIFLDEIGEMPMEMQVKLLRVLQERRVRPVGGDTEVAFEARVITATNRNLEDEIAEKRFREDLYYRVNVVPINVPPLRAREGDVLFLAQFFLQRIAKQTGKRVERISAHAARKLLDYDWPGNVRELENCIERAVALCRLNELTVDDLPPKLLQHSADKLVISTESPMELVTIDEMSRRYVRQVMTFAKGNKTHAAKLLGIDRRSLYRRLEGASAAPADAEPKPPETEPDKPSEP